MVRWIWGIATDNEQLREYFDVFTKHGIEKLDTVKPPTWDIINEIGIESWNCTSDQNIARNYNRVTELVWQK